VLGAFVAQFYDDKPVPRLILLSHDLEEQALLAEALSLKAEHKVELSRPQRGAKRKLIDNALHNAREALARRWPRAQPTRLLEQLAEIFGLEATPERIEVYDNSHTQGGEPYGAMIVAGPEGFRKNAYRKFKIRDPRPRRRRLRDDARGADPALPARPEGRSRTRRRTVAGPRAARRRPGPA
jgi:excinuclease ABC subunit C